ncbi:hypothetical protein E1B28_013029 [Marasmius oreades]|uniref:F-box domain-containing protein n=1 Tax=Marasmius oreades TaxID=181124 RepID=A0A9P7UPH0_9AGAR|nr:uncharacterized protein E1B28_013029 [Marasmius oreades]KAG7087049.1 hypothetical protein E1B28_013029 [Marasmius oreades]
MSGQEARGDPLNQGLPPELVDNMIQFCSDDRDTLCSLSLVCKSWLPLVQSYLFDRICIKPLPENERCDSVLKTLTIYYIQHVVLNLGPQREFTGNEEGEVRYLLEVVDRLKDSKVLKSLSIWIYHRPNFTPYRQLLEKLSSGSFRTILELKIYFGDLQDIVIADIIRFICSFPRLQALCGEFFSLVAPSNMVDSVTPVVQYTLPTSLNALRVWVPSTSDATDDLDKWFSSQSPRAVSELSISMTPSLKFPFYAASCSRCLRTLTLLLYPDSQSPGPYGMPLSWFTWDF